MSIEEGILQVLKHDLHKIQVPEFLPHKEALVNENARKADRIAAWFSRNFLREEFEESFYRKSLIFLGHHLKKPCYLINQHRQEANDIFQETNIHRLHNAILQSKLLNLFNEARTFPYTSLKYHLLLVGALYYNFLRGHEMNQLYLCENLEADNPIQIIYKDKNREWAILPRNKNNLSRLYPQFYRTWERRIKPSIGGDFRDLNEILLGITSWTVALATIEDFRDLLRKL